MADGYEAFDVKQLYAMVDAARQGLTPSRTQVAAWRRANQMLDQHAAALRRHRDQLAMRWPPESNAASAAYLAELDRLLLAVEQTSRASRANAAQIGHVADAIEQAHTTLKPVYDEYVSNETKLARYEATVQAAGAGGRTTHGPVGEALAEGATKLFTSPPVDDGRQAALVRQAREAMAPLTGAAQDATWHMQPPPEYVPPRVGVYTGATQFGDDSPGGAIRPVSIDPPAHARSAPGPGYGVNPDKFDPITPTDPGNAPNGGADTGPPLGRPSEGPRPSTVVGGTDPVLSGVAAPPAASTSPVLSPEISPVAGGGPTVGVPPVAGNGESGVPLRSFGTTGGFGGGAHGARPDGGRPLPVGGVIGGQPGRAMGSARAGVQRINPVGGVIGSAGGGRGSAAGASVVTPGAPGAGRRRHGGTAEDDRYGDTDDPWEVQVGVPPTIEADHRQPRHDPGRGVIGIDR